MLEGRKEGEEKRQWEGVERKEGFYKQEEEITTKEWDVKETTRAMKDMDSNSVA